MGLLGRLAVALVLMAVCLRCVVSGAHGPGVHVPLHGAASDPHTMHVTHEHLVAEAALTLVQPYDVRVHATPTRALDAYALWHNQTLADPASCRAAGAVVWIAAAGWGDSVNALTSSFRYAIGNGRLFFIIWRSANDESMWRRGLQQPDFTWDWHEALEKYHHCRFAQHDLDSYRANRGDHQEAARVVTISGTITADHPLAGSLDELYATPRTAFSALSDGLLQDYLLRPNAKLAEWIGRTTKALKAKRKKSFQGVVGMQVRTGYADAADQKQRPSNANFLASGDERLFLEKFRSVFASRFDSNPDRTRVFLMTDSPQVRDFLVDEIQGKLGVQVVTVSDGEVAHCGPSRTITDEGVLRMLTEWFVFKRATDVHIITAWSLFGGSAVEGKSEGDIVRVDASNCGKPGAKPCQMR